MASAWHDYQEEAAAFFRRLGFDAQTNVTVKGSRTRHDIDVLVKSRHVGFDVMWIIECKHWRTAVSKVHVLALRSIVLDIGADRGILLSESGFQSGAIEAASLTNVHVTSIAQLEVSARTEIQAVRLSDLNDRVSRCRTRYWDISKEDRIKHGLRPDVYEIGYSGNLAIEVFEKVLLKAFQGQYPIHIDHGLPRLIDGFGESFATPEALIAALETGVSDLEAKLDRYDSSQSEA